MNYKIVIHQGPQGGFWAEAPALPGCVSQGDTLDELKANMREAIEGYLMVLREEGRTPEPDVEIAEVVV
jgi:predicted RNase H-like HicB family nuclease